MFPAVPWLPLVASGTGAHILHTGTLSLAGIDQETLKATSSKKQQFGSSGIFF